MRSRRGAARSVAAPFPARHARPSLRLGWAAAPAPACRGVPPAPAPVAPGARRAVCAQGFLSAASGRPCASLCVSPLCAAPPLARAGLRGAVGRPRAPPPWARARFGRGRRCPPAPPPSGVRALSLPRGGSCWRGLRRAFWCLRRPPGVGVGAAAAAAAALLRPSVSLPGACLRFSAAPWRVGGAVAHVVQRKESRQIMQCPNKIRRAAYLSAQDTFPRKLNKI